MGQTDDSIIHLEQVPMAMNYILAEIKRLTVIVERLAAATNNTATAPTENVGFITRKEAAELLCISLNTLDSYAIEGKVKFYRIGNRVLYKPHEVIAAAELINTGK